MSKLCDVEQLFKKVEVRTEKVDKKEIKNKKKNNVEIINNTRNENVSNKDTPQRRNSNDIKPRRRTSMLGSIALTRATTTFIMKSKAPIKLPPMKKENILLDENDDKSDKKYSTKSPNKINNSIRLSEIPIGNSCKI